LTLGRGFDSRRLHHFFIPMATTTPLTIASRPISARWSRVAFEIAGLAVLIAAADGLALLLSGRDGASRSVWLGAGVGLGALIVRGANRWPAILLATYAMAYAVTRSPSFSLAVSIGATAQGVAAFAELKIRRYRTPRSAVRNTIELILSSGVLLPIVGATVGAAMLAMLTPMDHSDIGRTWVKWCIATGTGAILTAPLTINLMSRRRESWPRGRVLEALTLLALLAAVALTSYTGLIEIGEGEGLAALAFPFLIWASLRFGMTGASLVSLIVTLIVLWGTSRAGIPSGIDSPLGTFYRNFLCGTMAGCGLVLAAVFEDGRRNAEALAVSEANFRRLTEEASDAILLSRGDEGRIVSANRRALELLGYSREEFQNMRVLDLIPPGDRAAHPPREIVAGARPQLFERDMLHKSGRIVPVEVSARRLEDGRVQAILRDASERKRSETELRAALAMLQATLDSTTDGILVVDEELRIRGFNRRFTEMWNLPDEIVDSRDDERALEFVCDQLRDPEAFRAKVRHLYERPEETSFDVLEFKDGRVYERYSQPQFQGAKPRGRVWSFRDVTRSRLLEGQLRHAQKMEAVGSLAGGVAHDFNNLLTAIMGHSSLMLAEMEEDHALREEVAGIHRATERAAMLTRQLLTFSRQQLLEPRVLDLNGIVRPMHKMLERTLGERIRMINQLASEPLLVRADGGQIEQVLLNLSINARDAMPGGGSLTIQTARVRLETESARVNLPPGEYVRLTVIDTGLGMYEMTRSRIFEPFFTTKDRGRGTGLGLATVYGIMRQAGGSIEVDSEPGRGSLFDLYFPLAEGAAQAEEEPAAMVAARRGSGTVLLVEDEDSVRMLLADAVREAGFEVVSVGHGRDALRLAAGHPGHIDILVTDIVMPGLSGPELARELAGHRPDLRVLFISGYTADELAPSLSGAGGQGFLQKPFSPPTLVRKIQDVLESPVT
jgi:two-component system cell cycle sensor histidine kinase/response regulator CckA